MRRIRHLAALAMLLGLGAAPFARAETVTRVDRLLSHAERFERERAAKRGAAYVDLITSTDPAVVTLREDPSTQLVFVDGSKPFYYRTENIDASATISTDEVWPGGAAGLSLTGSTTLLGRLAIWDGGGVRTSHQEFGGRVTQMDSPSGNSSHSTHVAGTMIAAGVDSDAQGMSYEGTLAAYDWNSDTSEMASAAAIDFMNVSNHSYGFATGWSQSGGNWYWYGDINISTTTDYGFGFYGSTAQTYDQIARDAPFYTICKSSGNDRNDFGPGAGGTHFMWDDGWVTSNDTRDPDPGATGYNTVNWFGTAKNIITVGAVNDITSGYSVPGDVVMSSFSNWGPTDDGRIKPDLVANGVSLRSCTSSSNTSYSSFSGTSMSSPNLAGSLNLLVRHYEATHAAATPFSATVKAVAIHTADEAGSSDGPDYAFGWGLMNTMEAALLIDADGTSGGRIFEGALPDGNQDEYWFTQAASGPVRLTMAWTDLPGTPTPASLDPTAPMLVNDLDVRLEDLATRAVFEPWILDPANPSDAATTGDNSLDNVEQIWVQSLPAGDYRVTVSHKGGLASAGQDYALISSTSLSATPPATSVPEIASATDALAQSVHPNPFSDAARIEYAIPTDAKVSVVIYDLAGRRVRTLERGESRTAGTHHVDWNGRDDAGRVVAAGVYLSRVTAGETARTEKIVRLRTR